MVYSLFGTKILCLTKCVLLYTLQIEVLHMFSFILSFFSSTKLVPNPSWMNLHMDIQRVLGINIRSSRPWTMPCRHNYNCMSMAPAALWASNSDSGSWFGVSRRKNMWVMWWFLYFFTLFCWRATEGPIQLVLGINIRHQH